MRIASRESLFLESILGFRQKIALCWKPRPKDKILDCATNHRSYSPNGHVLSVVEQSRMIIFCLLPKTTLHSLLSILTKLWYIDGVPRSVLEAKTERQDLGLRDEPSFTSSEWSCFVCSRTKENGHFLYLQ